MLDGFVDTFKELFVKRSKTFKPSLKCYSSDLMINSGSILKGFESIKEIKISLGLSSKIVKKY